MERKRILINFIVTLVLLVVMAGIAITGISIVMGTFTSYYFDGTDEASARILLQMYGTLKNTRLIMIAMLFLSIFIKCFQFLKIKK